MKNIALKTVEFVHDGQTVKMSYQAQLVEVLRQPLNGINADLEELRHSLRILDALDKAGDTLQLEDADFEYLKSYLPRVRWPVKDKAVLTFIEDVTNPAE